MAGSSAPGGEGGVDGLHHRVAHGVERVGAGEGDAADAAGGADEDVRGHGVVRGVSGGRAVCLPGIERDARRASACPFRRTEGAPKMFGTPAA